MKRNLSRTKGTGFVLLAILTFISAISTRGQLFGPPASRDVEQGQEVAKMVEQQIGLCASPRTEDYLKKVGGRLVKVVNDQRWNFSFQIVDQAEPNAFAIPGGGIYISRGLLTLVNREDELAGVLGHEMAHVTERHSARQQRKGFLPGLLSVPGKIVGGIVSEDLGSLINAPVNTLGGAWLSRYSRGQETDSDRIGTRTSAEAGYEPQALADILQRLDRDVAMQSGQERRFSIFDSHPMTDTRLKDIRRRAADLKPAVKAPIAADSAALFAELDGLWWGNNPEAGAFDKDQFLQPTIGFTITFPAGWKHRNTPQYVISSHPEQEAMLLLGIAGSGLDPEAAGQKFIQKMRNKARLEPVSARATSIGKFPAFVVTYLDRSGRSATYLHFGWVAMGETTYELIGLGPEKHRETLREAALTLRPLTEEERKAVTGKRLRVVSAREGERLEELGARTGNLWSPAYTALANGLETDAALKKGRLVKIARKEPAVH
jgi:predicted Zn-dependent protease